MPSGSHSSNGGSHFSGGGSSSSSSGGSHFSTNSSSRSSSSSSSSSYSGGSGSTHYHNYYYSGHSYVSRPFNWKAFWILIFVIIGITLGALDFVFFARISHFNEMVKKCNADYEYYQAMCQRAHDDEDYMTTAEVYDMFYNEYAEKYYVVYRFNGYTGQTYSIYTCNEAQSMLHNTFELAINCKNTEINASTDSILMDYYHMDIAKDGEYVKVVSQKNNSILLTTIFLIGFASCIFGIVLVAKKKFKFETKNNETSISTTPNVVEKKEPTTWTCEFCSSLNSVKETRCKSCGASRQKSKKSTTE